jgi:hypothetical protein
LRISYQRNVEESRVWLKFGPRPPVTDRLSDDPDLACLLPLTRSATRTMAAFSDEELKKLPMAMSEDFAVLLGSPGFMIPTAGLNAVAFYRL